MITPTRLPLWWRIKEFVQVYRLYRTVHSRRYAAGIAWGCAFRGLPF